MYVEAKQIINGKKYNTDTAKCVDEHIKVDRLLDGTMNKILEAGDTPSFERARCTVKLYGETVSVYAKVTDCDSGDYCGGIIEFESGDCFGTITCRQNCYGERTEKLEVNDAEQTPAVKKICENGSKFVMDVLSAVQEASLACPAGRWDVYDGWREVDGFIQWDIDNLACENGAYECDATVNGNEPVFHAKIDWYGNLTVSHEGEEIPVEDYCSARDLKDAIYREGEKLENEE